MTPIAIHRPGGPNPQQGKGGRGGLASLTRNRSSLLALGGAGLVVVLALLRRGGGSAPSSSTAPAAPGTSTYDSTANDVYNSIQPEIDQLAAALSDLQNRQTTPTTPPHVTTLPAPLPGPPAVHTGPHVTRPSNVGGGFPRLHVGVRGL